MTTTPNPDSDDTIVQGVQPIWSRQPWPKFQLQAVVEEVEKSKEQPATGARTAAEPQTLPQLPPPLSQRLRKAYKAAAILALCLACFALGGLIGELGLLGFLAWVLG